MHVLWNVRPRIWSYAESNLQISLLNLLKKQVSLPKVSSQCKWTIIICV